MRVWRRWKPKQGLRTQLIKITKETVEQIIIFRPKGNTIAKVANVAISPSHAKITPLNWSIFWWNFRRWNEGIPMISNTIRWVSNVFSCFVGPMKVFRTSLQCIVFSTFIKRYAKTKQYPPRQTHMDPKNDVVSHRNLRDFQGVNPCSGAKSRFFLFWRFVSWPISALQ